MQRTNPILTRAEYDKKYVEYNDNRYQITIIV
jgi:hypothetical protein